MSSGKWITVRVRLHNENDGAEISDYEAHKELRLALFDMELEMEDGSKWSITHCENGDD
ncbi:hypothetical protein GCM10010149_88340 [Nonomuraea roseoviolacea subsp. roseoviolacea]